MAIIFFFPHFSKAFDFILLPAENKVVVCGEILVDVISSRQPVREKTTIRRQERGIKIAELCGDCEVSSSFLNLLR